MMAVGLEPEDRAGYLSSGACVHWDNGRFAVPVRGFEYGSLRRDRNCGRLCGQTVACCTSLGDCSLLFPLSYLSR